MIYFEYRPSIKIDSKLTILLHILIKLNAFLSNLF